MVIFFSNDDNYKIYILVLIQGDVLIIESQLSFVFNFNMGDGELVMVLKFVDFMALD